ncbi:MAG: Major facilitator superfamily [Microgenomates group bacterium GW2011_GWB1_44_8]|nr:MAG: Major facilitator superfamily [Microgenomates group bacterium GW2011_GWB1_44_8]
MLYPVMPIFLTTIIGAPVSVVGIVEGVAEGTQYVTQGLSGWLADRLNRKKPIALVGYALGAAAKPLIGLSTTWPAVLGCRFLDRFGSATRSAPRDALIASSVQPQYRGRAFGLEGIGDNLGAVLGPLLAIVLIYGLNTDLRSIFYLALIPGIVAWAMMLFVKENKIEKSTLPNKASKFNAKALPKSFWKYILIIAIFGIGNSSNSFLILQAKNLGFSVGATIFLYALFNLMAAVIAYPAGGLSDRLGRKKLLLLAFSVFIVTYFGFALSRSLWVVGILFVFYGGFQGIFRAVGKTTAVDLVPSQLRATGLGIFSATIGFTTFFASMLAGQLWVRINPSSVFLYGVICAAAGLLAIPLLWPKTEKVS